MVAVARRRVSGRCDLTGARQATGRQSLGPGRPRAAPGLLPLRFAADRGSVRRHGAAKLGLAPSSAPCRAILVVSRPALKPFDARAEPGTTRLGKVPPDLERLFRLRKDERLAGLNRRAVEMVRDLNLPDLVPDVAAVMRRRDRPARVVRLHAVRHPGPVRSGRTGNDAPDHESKSCQHEDLDEHVFATIANTCSSCQIPRLRPG